MREIADLKKAGLSLTVTVVVFKYLSAGKINADKVKFNSNSGCI